MLATALRLTRPWFAAGRDRSLVQTGPADTRGRRDTSRVAVMAALSKLPQQPATGSSARANRNKAVNHSPRAAWPGPGVTSHTNAPPVGSVRFVHDDATP